MEVHFKVFYLDLGEGESMGIMAEILKYYFFLRQLFHQSYFR